MSTADGFCIEVDCGRPIVFFNDVWRHAAPAWDLDHNPMPDIGLLAVKRKANP